MPSGDSIAAGRSTSNRAPAPRTMTPRPFADTRAPAVQTENDRRIVPGILSPVAQSSSPSIAQCSTGVRSIGFFRSSRSSCLRSDSPILTQSVSSIAMGIEGKLSDSVRRLNLSPRTGSLSMVLESGSHSNGNVDVSTPSSDQLAPQTEIAGRGQSPSGTQHGQGISVATSSSQLVDPNASVLSVHNNNTQSSSLQMSEAPRAGIKWFNPCLCLLHYELETWTVPILFCCIL